MPTTQSHCCRGSATYQNNKFLHPGTKILNLYDEFTKAATDAHVRVVGRKYLTKLFYQLNFSVFIPRKDQCDTCVGAKHGNVKQEDYVQHIQDKDEARMKKNIDKEAANDLQVVLLCPQSNASAMYYKTKYQLHNFTFYNMQTKDGYCYCWDKINGNLSSGVFAHIQHKHFSEVLQESPQIEKLIVWSDGCGYQNRNTTVSNMYLDLSLEYNITIEQKYLVSGHTQMECDSMHYTIERKRI